MAAIISRVDESSVRQLIANGKSKAALDRAKEIHKSNPCEGSEALLLDAYRARIRALLDQNLELEAKSLLDLVKQRFPKFAQRMEDVLASVAVRGGRVDDVLKALNDPQLPADQRAEIERLIQNEVTSLRVIAECSALDLEHPLRRAAAALQRAFDAVTSGPVADEALDLAEVSRRSPLAQWKMLIKAIACFYRHEDVRCREYLDAILPESAPARLVPALRAILEGRRDSTLSAAASNLVSAAVQEHKDLMRALRELDNAFTGESSEKALLNAASKAFAECRIAAPELAERLQDQIAARLLIGGLPDRAVRTALGPIRFDRSSLSLLHARGLEQSGDPEDIGLACVVWEEFRSLAVKEGLFEANSVEVAVLYLHMAELIARVHPRDLKTLRSIKDSPETKHLDTYFLYPEELFSRASKLDPQPETFEKWLEWAKLQPGKKGERVAELWHQSRPRDLDPLLYLISKTLGREAFQPASKYLTLAEQIDKLHPGVRRARAQVLLGSIFRNIQQKKPHLAVPKLTELAELSQMRQGDRQAVIPAARCVGHVVSGAEAEAAVELSETVRLLGSETAATVLVHGVALECRRPPLEKLKPVEKLSAAEKQELPSAMARLMALSEYFGWKRAMLPWTWVVEARKQLSRNSGGLDTEQLRLLAEGSLRAEDREFGYLATVAGLERGGSMEAGFLLLRAQSLPEWKQWRRVVCIAAAAELARKQRDLPLVEKAIDLLHQCGRIPPEMDEEDATDVLEQEREARSFPTIRDPGPDYEEFAEDVCDCAECRSRRGEPVDDDFDDEFFEPDDDEEDIFADAPFGMKPPPGMPAEVGRMLINEIRKAIEAGEDPDEFMKRMAARLGQPAGGPKGKRK